MKPFIYAASIAALLSGCGLETPRVKEKWRDDLLNFSFVPVYPPRGAVNIGDIRVHLESDGGPLTDSQLFRTWEDAGLVRKQPPRSSALLPGFEVVRVGRLDIGSLGLLGALASLLGPQLQAANTVQVSLSDLETAEASSVDLSRKLAGYLASEFSDPTFNDEAVWGICTAAINLCYEDFDKVNVSVISRVLTAKKVTYLSGDGFSTIDGLNGVQIDPDAAKAEGEGIAASNAVEVTAAQGTLQTPVVIGVEAITYKFGRRFPELAPLCEQVAQHIQRPQIYQLVERNECKSNEP